MSSATSVYEFWREAFYEDSNQTFTPSSSWDLSGLAGTDLKLYLHITQQVLKLGIGLM